MLYVQKFSRIPIFKEISEKRIVSDASGDKITIDNYHFEKSNSFGNFIKFRTKPLFISILMLLFTSYSMVMLNIATDSWFRNNGLITLIICFFYVLMFFKFLSNLYHSKSNKLIDYSLFMGVAYIVLTAILQYKILAAFAFNIHAFKLNQIILYNYFYIFIFNMSFYFLIDIFEKDYRKFKNKKLSYYESGSILLVKEEV